MTPKTKAKSKGRGKRDEVAQLEHERIVRFVYDAKTLKHLTLDQVTDLVKKPEAEGGLGRVIPRSTVYNYLREAGIERVKRQAPTDEQRVAAVESLDYLIQGALSMASTWWQDSDGATHRRPEATRIAAINLAARLEEQKANLIGTKAPVQVEATVNHVPNVDLELVKLLELNDKAPTS